MLATIIANSSQRIIAITLEGQIFWERDEPLQNEKVAIHRNAADRCRELITVRNNHFKVINLSTGKTVRTVPFPRSIQHKLWLQYTGMSDRPGKRRGTDIAGDLLIRYGDAETFDEDQTRLMVLDDQFNEIWSIDNRPPGLGHTFGC